MAIKSKQPLNSSGTKEHIIKVNPYELPDVVLTLMSKICSSMDVSDVSRYFAPINSVMDKHFSENDDTLLKRKLWGAEKGWLKNENLWDDIVNGIIKIRNIAEVSVSISHTKVAVAGGFSSGKSTFLNHLTGHNNLLPTGVEPVSVVQTRLNCTRNCHKVTVKGENLQGVLVDLDANVLQSIQHSSKTNIYLASVLKNLYIDIPSTEFDGIAFIDTPGYNNSTLKNESNAKTDRETAIEAASCANVIFWFVDIDKGTLPKDDIQMLHEFDGIPKLIIFSKAENKASEANSIVKCTASLIKNEFKPEEILDIIAYSTAENRIYATQKGTCSFKSLIEKVRSQGNDTDDIMSTIASIKNAIDEEIDDIDNYERNLNKKHKELVSRKNQAQRRKGNSYWTKEELVDDLKTKLIESYDEVFNIAERYQILSKDCIELIQNLKAFSINVEREHSFSDTRQFDKWVRPILKCIDAYNDTYNDFEWYETEARTTTLDIVSQALECSTFFYDPEEEYEQASKECSEIIDTININKEIRGQFVEFRDDLVKAIRIGVDDFRKSFSSQRVVEDVEALDVFKAIDTNNLTIFQRSFIDGVDINICNNEGYNVLTYAVLSGNNDMVQFLLDHGADVRVVDKRGYNAYLTAAENQYKDICKLLLAEDPSLVSTQTSTGECALDLANKNSFAKWIQNK